MVYRLSWHDEQQGIPRLISAHHLRHLGTAAYDNRGRSVVHPLCLFGTTL